MYFIGYFDSSRFLEMSFTTYTTVNSGPLIVRTALDQSNNNTYVLGLYDKPIDPNYLLMTSNNGLITPSRDLNLNSVVISSTIVGNKSRFASLSTTTISTTSISTLTLSTNTLMTDTLSTTTESCSTIQTVNLNTSTIYSNGFTLENGSVRYTPLTAEINTGSAYVLNSTDWWGKYIFVTNTSNDVTVTLPLTGNIPPNGTVMYITSAVTGRNTIIANLITGNRTVSYPNTAHVIYYSSLNRWYSIS